MSKSCKSGAFTVRFLLFCCVAATMWSCGSSRRDEFRLKQEDYAVSLTDESKTPVYLTSTRSIDSADVSTIFADVWKLETDSYPDSIRAFVRVMDSSGNFITNMADPYYRGTGDYRRYWSGISEKIGRKEIAISNFTVREFSDLDSIPYSIVLALDHGGSMRGTIESLQDAAELFLNIKRPYDRIGVVKFDRQAVVEVPITADPGLIRAQYRKNGLEGFGLYTSLLDAAKDAMLQLRNEPPDNPRVLVLFTDGEDNYSKTTSIELYRLADSLDVHIFPVGFGYTNDTTMMQIAEVTGGKYYKAYSSRQLRAVFEDIYRSLRNYYLVTYQPPVMPGLHVMNVNLSVPGARNDLTARAEYDKGKFGSTTDTGAPPVLYEILFDFAQATIRPESQDTLNEIARILKRNPRMMIGVHGHTDNVGGEEFNQRLSEQRAEAVVQALVDRGIDRMRLRPRGYGMSQPVAPNDTEENRQRNRRTEFVVLRQ